MRKPLYSIWATFVLSVSLPTLCDDSAAVTTCPASVPELKPTPQPACSLSSEPVDLAPEFLSFEEWKEKMAQRAEVAKDLAAAEHDTTNEGQKEHETTNALNDLAHDQPPSPDTAAFAVPSTPLPRSHIPLIDRFNYASSECNARIQAADKSGKSAVSILTRTKDKYMLSPCQTSEQKFVVVELCEDIRIDTVQLANFEFFSGVFKDIRVSVAHAYTDDGQGWVLLGDYKAKNIRGVQTFHPTRHLPHFYRYLRVDFLSYYGSEYYCPVSLLRVYGLTPMEEWKYDVWVAEWEAMYGGSSNIAATSTISSGVMDTIPRSPETIKEVETDTRTKFSSAHETTPETTSEHSTGAFTVKMDDSHTPSPSPSMADTSPEQTAQATHTDPSSQDHHTKGSCQLPAVQTDYPIDFILIDTSNESVSDSTHSSNGNHQSDGTKTQTTKVIVTTTTSVAVVPTALGGESVYRMILNRLSNLEGNQTLYARYVEDQARSANDRLRILEEEVGRLGALAKTQQQTFMKLLERHRLDQEMEISRIASRIDSLAHEVVLEKRIGIAQLALLSTVLIFMALTRGSRGDPVVESARIVNSLRREVGSGFYRGLRTSNEWVSSFRTGGIRAFSGPDETTAAAVRNSRTRVAGSSLLGRRSRSRRGSSGLRSGEEAGAGGLGSGVGDDPESTSELPRQSESLKDTQVNTSGPTPGSPSIRQQQMLLLSKAPTKNLGLFGSRSASTSGRALDQLHIPGSAKKLARNVHLHEVKSAGRDENARREAKAKLKDREVIKTLNRDSGGVGRVPFPSSHGQNTPGEPDTDSAWVDDTDVEGSISSPQIEKYDHDVWLRQSNGFLSPFELAPPPKPQHRRTTKPAENLKLDIKESSLDPVLQQTNLI